MQLAQPEDLSFGSSDTSAIVDELEIFESGPFAPFQNGGVVTYTTPCVYLPPTATMRASVEAMLTALQQAPTGTGKRRGLPCLPLAMRRAAAPAVGAGRHRYSFRRDS